MPCLPTCLSTCLSNTTAGVCASVRDGGRSGDRRRSPYPFGPTPNFRHACSATLIHIATCGRSHAGLISAGLRPREFSPSGGADDLGNELPPGVSGIRVGAGTSIGAPCADFLARRPSHFWYACPKYRAIRPSSRRQRVPEPSTRACPNLPCRPSLSDATASARSFRYIAGGARTWALLCRSARRSAEELLRADARWISTNAMPPFLTPSDPPSRCFLSTPSDRRI